MAMLQFGGTLSNPSIRITPRVSWWITAQHLLYAKSMASDPKPAEVVVVSKKDNKQITKTEVKPSYASQYVQKRNSERSSLITSVFNSLSEHSVASSFLNKKINSASNVNQLLQLTLGSNFSRSHASDVMRVLINWMSAGKVTIEELEKDYRFKKICHLIDFKLKDSNREKHFQNLNSPYGLLGADDTDQKINRLSVDEMITVLSVLAREQKRSTPLLQSISSKLAVSHTQLNIKQSADILYTITVLNFYHEELVKKVCQCLCHSVNANTNAAVIGSILKSMGLLRLRDEKLLNILSTWILANKDKIRSQESSNLLMTLASVGFITENFNEVLEHIIIPLKESDMCQSSEWLDIVWSLAVLNKASNSHYESVLNEGYINRLADISSSKASKLLNVNAAARLLAEDYKGPLLPESSSVFNCLLVRTRDKIELANSVVSALKILLPSDSSYLNIKIDTKMGFFYDAEFIVDSKCTPLPLCTTEKDKQIFRIAVFTCNYHEYCRKKWELIGPVKLFKRLLNKKGLKVLLIPYSDINSKDKLVKRVQYINENVKKLVEETLTQ